MAAEAKPRLREIYEQEVAVALQEKFDFTSSMQIPRPVKVVINMGLGRAFNNPKILESALVELGTIDYKWILTLSALLIAGGFYLRGRSRKTF